LINLIKNVDKRECKLTEDKKCR